MTLSITRIDEVQYLDLIKRYRFSMCKKGLLSAHISSSYHERYIVYRRGLFRSKAIGTVTAMYNKTHTTIYLAYLEVLRRYQRKGVGSFILEAMKGMGVNIGLKCLKDNVDFYTKNGFMIAYKDDEPCALWTPDINIT